MTTRQSVDTLHPLMALVHIVVDSSLVSWPCEKIAVAKFDRYPRFKLIKL